MLLHDLFLIPPRLTRSVLFASAIAAVQEAPLRQIVAPGAESLKQLEKFPSILAGFFLVTGAIYVGNLQTVLISFVFLGVFLVGHASLV